MAGKGFRVMALAMVLAAAFGAEKAHAQQQTLDFLTAIQRIADQLSPSIRGERVAVVLMRAGSPEMSNRLIQEMTLAFVRNQARYGFGVVSRDMQELMQVLGELYLQMDPHFDQDTAQRIGHLLNVQLLVTGTFDSFGNDYRFVVQLITVQGANIRYAHAENVRNDGLVSSLLGAAGRTPPAHVAQPPAQIVPQQPPAQIVPQQPPAQIVPQQPPAPITPQQPPAETTEDPRADFTTEERWRTFFLNLLMPGLGSYVVMNSTGRGMAQMVVLGVGSLLVYPLITETREAMLTAGAFFGLNLVINIFDSVRTMPSPYVYNHFTAGQRWGTFWLNLFLPGIGSFAVMGDGWGGAFQMLFSGGAWVFFGFGLEYETPELMTLGGISLAAGLLINIMQSAFHGRNIGRSASQRIATLVEPWSLALVPGQSGIEGVSLTHTLRF